MADNNSETGSSCSSDDSEHSFIPGYHVEVEEENEKPTNDDNACDSVLNFAGPYADEPLADEEWLRDYQKKREKEDRMQKELQERIDGVIILENWCSCGNCKVEMLQNVFEAKCCREIERCIEACNKEEVIEEVNSPPTCITLHPGFRPVCLEKWSLKQSASKYKTQDRRRYKQSGSEHQFLRAVSYREFSRLVYGYLGVERIPLPACVYHAIRKEFTAQSGEYTGFDED